MSISMMQNDLEFAAKPNSNEKNKISENKENLYEKEERLVNDNVDIAGNRYEETIKEFDFEQAAREDFQISKAVGP